MKPVLLNRHRTTIVEPMEPSADDELVLGLTVEYLKDFGEWPKLQDIHQKIHQELQKRADVQASARRLAPMPFVGGGYSFLGETFAPPLDVIATSDEGRRLIECLVGLINLAREKYENSRGRPEVTSGEFQAALGIDARTARAARELVHRVPWVTEGGASNAEGWSVTIAHEVTRWDGLRSADDLLLRLAEIRKRDDQHLAALTRAQHRMGGIEHGAGEGGKEPTRRGRWDRAASYLERHPLIRILGAFAIPLGIVVAILALVKS